MNVSNVRNGDKEQEHNVARFYDIYNMEHGGLTGKEYIGSVALRNMSDKGWAIIRPDEDIALELEKEPFGDFMQCIAELKIQKELAE